MEAIIQYFGAYLGKLLNKSTQAMRGLLRIVVNSVTDMSGQGKVVSIDQLVNAFQTTLLERLERMGVPGAKDIVQKMVSELLQNQSLLTISCL